MGFITVFLFVVALSCSFLSKLSEVTQRKVVELIWHLPPLKEKELMLLAKAISHGQLCLQVKLYLIQIVHHRLFFLQKGMCDSVALYCCCRFMWKDCVEEDIPLYLSFLLTVLVGK